VWFESIRVAPTDALRIYAMQHRPPLRTEPWEATLFRSDDGGRTWTSYPFALLEREWRLYLLAVDPTDPDRILARTQNLYPDGRERVMLSEDGGRTFTEVLRMRQVADAAWSPDGRTVWVGGPLDGLHRSDDGGRTFAVVQPSYQVRCTLARGRHEIWVCGDDWADGFGIARSTDGGDTFEPLARLRSITGILDCPAGSRVATVCPAHQAMLNAILDLAPNADAGAPSSDAGASRDGGTIERDGGDWERDAGTSDRDAGRGAGDGGAAARSSGGCSCRVAAGRGAQGPLTLFGALAVCIVVGRRWRPRGAAQGCGKEEWGAHHRLAAVVEVASRPDTGGLGIVLATPAR
jgi:hypothetical protein